MKHRMISTLTLMSVIILMLLLSSCSTAALPSATQTPWIIVITNTPTVDMAPYITEAAETVFANLTQTASALPTATPTFTATSTQTFTATSTFTPVPSNTPYYTATYTRTSTPKTPTSTPTQAGWNCKITFQLVEDNHVFGTYEDFDARWTIKNTGTQTWDQHDVDYRYMSGTEMQKFEKVYDLPATVAPGESITITVDMKAPSSAGYYETFWALARHTDGFCSLPTRIKVK